MKLMYGVLRNDYVKGLGITLIALYVSYYLGTAIVLQPDKLRLLLAVGLALILYAISLATPHRAMIGLFLLLPFLGLIRRSLIPLAGWSSFDPFVILVPAMVCFLGLNYYFERYIRKIPELDDSKLFTLIRWLMFVHILQVFNPLQGSLFAGMAGVMFYVTPLMWMTLSRKFFNEGIMHGFLKAIPIIASITALYGLKQIYFGFFSFEEAWMELADYNSLNVLGTMRAISSFTSSSEYAQFLSIAIVICWAMMLKNKSKRMVSTLPLPLLFFALFMTSQRGAILFTMAALSLLMIFSVNKGKARFLATLITLIVMTGTYLAIININTADNALIAHQVDGLANPFDEEHSTLGLHWTLLIEGFVRGLTNPLGYGLGASTIAGSKLGAGVIGSEIDITNIMISDGIVGFILYGMIIVKVLSSSYRLYKLDNSALSYSIWGILISSIGGWCIGGNYSTLAIIWICIGYMDRAYVLKSRQLQKQGG